MPYLTDLADVLRKAGLDVKEEPGWKTRGHGPMYGVRGVVCHHTAGAATGDMPSLGVLINGRSDLPGPLCQLGLARSGRVHVIAAGIAWHAGATVNDSVYGNNWSIGIEAENTGTGQAWPPDQMAAYRTICRALMTRYGLPADRVRGHKEICSPHGRKIDPHGIDMAAFRRALTQQEDEDDMSWEEKLTAVHPTTGAKSTTTAGSHLGRLAWRAVDTVNGVRGLRKQLEVQTELINELLAGAGDLTAAQIEAAAKRGAESAMPDWSEVAAAVADAVDHDLDVSAVEQALRNTFGQLDNEEQTT